MKIEALQVFVSVAEERSFSKAGERLFMSQPTVSRYIAELESKLGGKLFVRHAHACELTLLGTQVFVHAKRMMNEWETINALSREGGLRGQPAVRIGYTYQGMLQSITQVLVDMGLANRQMDLSVRFGDGTVISRLVREGKLDCAVMHLPSVSAPEGLEIRLICKCGMCVHVPVSHRLAKEDTVRLEQLAAETDVRTKQEKRFYWMADEAFRQLNLEPMKHVYVQNADDCMPITRYRNYVCLTPSIYPAWQGCKKVHIADWTMDFSLVFVTRASHATDITEHLYQLLCASMKQ